MKFRSTFVSLSLILLAAPQVAQGSKEDLFHRAYYLEHEEGKFAEALAIYEDIAASAKNASMRDQAVERAAVLTEELATADFTRILPQNTILYAELNRPGAQLSSLLDQLGLLGSVQDALAKKSIALSPELIEGLIGIRGAAIALTSLPMGSGAPGGIAVLHPGDLGLLRGLIESAVPVQGKVVDSIVGHPTYLIEEHAYVTFTRRLVLVSTARSEIEGCLRRIDGSADDSMANDPHMKENLALRGEDLFYVCVNAAPLRPMLNAMVTQKAGGHELAMAQALVDLQSFESVVMRAGVEADGMSMDVALRLDDAHRSLAFHFLRSAELDPRTLDTVPSGAAAFLAAAFNPAGPAIAPLEVDTNGQPVVTAMDIGREFFANTVGVSLFALPDAASGPIPGITLALTTNDAARTEAVFGLLLSVAQVASGSIELEPGTQSIAGRTANVYRVADGFPIFQTSTEETFFVSSSTPALETTLAALARQESVRKDPAFAGHLARMGKGVNQAMAAHGGRLLQIAKPYMEGQEAQMAGSIAPILERTVLSMISRHSSNELGMSFKLTGIPRIDGMLSMLLAQKTQGGHREEHAPAAPRKASVARKQQVEHTHDAKNRFDHHVQVGEYKQAKSLESELARQFKADSRAANNFAWALLTDDTYKSAFDKLALRVARLSNENDDYSTWQYLDTLALAEFRNGNHKNAIRYQKKAMESVQEHEDRQGLSKTLERYLKQIARSDA